MTDQPDRQVRFTALIEKAYDLLNQTERSLLLSSDPVERARLTNYIGQIKADIALLESRKDDPHDKDAIPSDYPFPGGLSHDQYQALLQDLKNIADRSEINTGGGAAFLNSRSDNSGGVNLSGGKTESISYEDRRQYFYGTQPPLPDTTTVRPVACHIPLNPSPLFQERPGEFEELERRLLVAPGPEANGTRLGLVGVTGMGGIGKTQLAVEVAYRLRDKGQFEQGIYWMVATGGEKDWEAQLAALAEATEYRPPGDDPGHPENTTRRARYMARYLCRSPRALLVLDNVDQPKLVSEVLPKLAGEKAHCAVLYTSRQRTPPPGAQVYSVERLPREAALRLLLETTRPEWLEAALKGEAGEEVKAALDLCEWVGYLPLALSHLRAVLVRSSRLTLARLLEQLHLKGAKWLDQKGDQDEKATLATLELSWERVRSEEARRLLLVTACFPEAALVPLWLAGLAAGLGQSAEPLEPLAESLEELQSLSLLDELGETSTRLHPYVTRFGREKLTELADQGQQFWVEGAGLVAATLDGLLEGVLPADLDGLEYNLWWRVGELGSLEWYSLTLQNAGRAESAEEAAAWAAYDVAYYLNEKKRPSEALSLLHRVLGLKSNYAYAFNERGRAYADLKQYEQAIADYGRAIALDPNYAAAYNNRGNAYADLKQYEQAIADYEQAIALDPNFAFAFYNRGAAYYALKQYEQAIADYERAIILDLNFAAAFYNRGLAYKKVGDLEAARRDFRRAAELGLSIAEDRLKELG